MKYLKWYTDTSWHQWWVKNVWRPSWTKLTTAIYGLPSILVLGAEQIGKLAGDDQISQLLAKVGVPNGVFAGLAFVALLHYILAGHDK